GHRADFSVLREVARVSLWRLAMGSWWAFWLVALVSCGNDGERGGASDASPDVARKGFPCEGDPIPACVPSCGPDSHEKVGDYCGIGEVCCQPNPCEGTCRSVCDKNEDRGRG